MAQQTAVEWLVDQVEDFIGLIPIDIIQQAKEMEKQQIEDAYRQGVTDEYGDSLDFTDDTDAKQYYTQTYGK
jgi:hypothetical protein